MMTYNIECWRGDTLSLWFGAQRGQSRSRALRTYQWLCIALGVTCSGLIGCNDHPIRRLDQSLSASNRVENRLPAKTKLDFLFVIDNSSSMGEEQKALADNFKTFSDFLFDELQGSADYRIAVTNSGVINERATCGADQAANGSFIYQPAVSNRPVSTPIVTVDGQTLDPPPGVLPVTSDCPEQSNPVISSDELNNRPESELPPPPADDPACSDPSSPACLKVRRKLLLEKEFRCHSTLGIGGCTIEKGLEAMRLALSCGGPNAELFKACCENYENRSPEERKAESYYNPACVIGDSAQEPAFLRPDATLVIIFISDENDCSTPADNPYASSRLICRPGWSIDNNADGVPDIYETECGLDPKKCFELECGQFAQEGMQVCHDKRCDVERYQGLGCEYSRRLSLTDVKEYRDFLLNLKARPLDQILVATIVGFRQYLRNINDELVLDDQMRPQELRYDPSQALPGCEDESDPRAFSDECCPNGTCFTRSIRHSCSIQKPRPVDCSGQETGSQECVDYCGDQNMSCDLVVIDEYIATPGKRYLDLADSLGANGLGCPRGQEPIVNQLTGDVIEQGECVNICVDDFIKPLRAIKERVADLLNTYCINRLPSCQVPATFGPDGEVLTPARECEGEIELNQADYYRSGIRVSRQCLLTRDQGGNCDEVEPLTRLPSDEWSFSLGGEGCAGVIELLNLPPAGSEIFIDFVVTAGELTDNGDTVEPAP